MKLVKNEMKDYVGEGKHEDIYMQHGLLKKDKIFYHTEEKHKDMHMQHSPLKKGRVFHSAEEKLSMLPIYYSYIYINEIITCNLHLSSASNQLQSNTEFQPQQPIPQYNDPDIIAIIRQFHDELATLEAVKCLLVLNSFQA